MRIQQWMFCSLTLLALGFSSVLVAQEADSTCVVKLYDHPDYKGEVRLRLTNGFTTKFELTGSDKWLSCPQITLPSDTSDFQIEGSVTWKHDRGGEQTASISSKVQFVDFSSSIRHLRSQRSWGKRMDQFVKELTKIEEQQKDRDASPSELIESNGPVHSNAIKSAEQRLRFELPNEHKQLLQDYGAWSFSGSFCVSVEDLTPANTQMQSIWGSPLSEFASLSDKSKNLYKASVMLFVEGGDGYGALIYHPNSSGDDYYWVHQDNLDEPVKLVDSQNAPRDYSSAMRWVIANQILFYYEDAFEGTFLDRSSATPFPYQLRLNLPTGLQLNKTKAEARLDVDWSKFE